MIGTGLSEVGHTRAKAAVAAMSRCITREESGNGIRPTMLHPGETATPILRGRGAGTPTAELARLLRPKDCAGPIRCIAYLPPHVCMNEAVMTPTCNRTFAEPRALPART